MTTFSTRSVKTLLPSILLVLLTACGGGGGGGEGEPTTPPPVVDPGIAPGDAALFLVRATFGPTSAEIDSVVALEYEAWLDRQLGLPQTLQLAILDDYLVSRNLSSLDTNVADLDLLSARMDAWWQTAITSEDQLRQRVAFALSEIFVVSYLDRQIIREVRGFASYHDMLAEHAFGNYRDLLEDVALHPIMGTYLSMRRNEKADDANNIRPDENFARECMQLFSLGLELLNLDGSPVLNNGNTVATYTQDDITEFSRVYTGWNFFDAVDFTDNSPESSDSYVLPMVPFEAFHDSGAKALLNGEVTADGLLAADDLDAALDNIFQHQNVAPFLAKHLIQRLVTSNPSAAYIQRIARVFEDNGQGTRGDLAAVVKALLLDDEAFSSANEFGGAKLKEPLLRLTQLWRAFSAQGVNGVFRYTFTEAFGQQPFGSPSVFNFFSADYSQPGVISDQGLVSPEFQILNDATVIDGTNKLRLFAHSESFPDTNPVLSQVLLDLSNEEALASDVPALLDHLDTLLLGGTMPAAMRTIINDYLDLFDAQTSATFIVQEAIYLIVTSPEFAVQQ